LVHQWPRQGEEEVGRRRSRKKRRESNGRGRRSDGRLCRWLLHSLSFCVGWSSVVREITL